MSSKGISQRIKLQSFDDMFGAEENTGATGTDAKPVDGQIVEMPLSELHSFKNHPFRVVDDENMDEMVESVKEYGVLVPAIVRPRAEGGYELISGHRRKHASEIAGKDTMPVIVRDCDNDEAVVIMVDANIQREDILISERAKAYQMKYEAMKHQGKAKGISLEQMSEEAGESRKTIQRLICLASLDKKLLDMVDEKKLSLRQGVDLSFIPQEQQLIVYDVIKELNVSLSLDQSARIKEASRKGYLNADFLRDYLSEKKPKPRKVVFSQKKLDNYFTPDMSNEDIEELIVKLLDEWKEKGDYYIMFQKKAIEQDKKTKGSRSVRKEKKGGDIKAKLISVLKVVVIPALFAGIVVCGLYLSMQNKLEAQSLKGQVLVMKEFVAANTYVKADEADKYFEVVSVEKIAIPTTAYTTISDLPKEGFYVENAMTKMQMVLKDDIVSKDEVMDKYRSGYVVTSFAAESFDDSVNGSLRKGDIVDVYAKDPATEMLTLMAENVYVSEVYDTAGKKISEDDEVATSFTVWVTPEEVESINTAVVYGGIQMYLKTE